MDPRLAVECGVCGAPAGQPCVKRGTNEPLTDPVFPDGLHQSRGEPGPPQLINLAGAATPEMRTPKPEEAAMAADLINTMAQLFAPWREGMMQREAQPNADSLLASAVATYAGAVLGELVGMGILADSAVPAALDGMRRNMERGVAAGKAKVARVADAVLQEDARQQGTERKQ